MKELISIIVPVFNVDTYLDKCIGSIIVQSYTNIEVILIDDGSKDSSPAICDRYASLDPRIIIIHKQNEGVSIARNIGVQLSTGNWIMFVDADDFLLQDAIQILYNIVSENDSDIAFGNSLCLSNGMTKQMFALHTMSTDKVRKNLPSLAIWGYLMKATQIKDSNMKFVEGLAFSEDGVFLNEVSLLYSRLSITNANVYVYRINPISACHSLQYEKKCNTNFGLLHV